MRFKKIASGKDAGNYRSTSGWVWTPKQVELYRATKAKASGRTVKVTRASGRKKMKKRRRVAKE